MLSALPRSCSRAAVPRRVDDPHRERRTKCVTTTHESHGIASTTTFKRWRRLHDARRLDLAEAICVGSSAEVECSTPTAARHLLGCLYRDGPQGEDWEGAPARRGRWPTSTTSASPARAVLRAGLRGRGRGGATSDVSKRTKPWSRTYIRRPAKRIASAINRVAAAATTRAAAWPVRAPCWPPAAPARPPRRPPPRCARRAAPRCSPRARPTAHRAPSSRRHDVACDSRKPMFLGCDQTPRDGEENWCPVACEPLARGAVGVRRHHPRSTARSPPSSAAARRARPSCPTGRSRRAGPWQWRQVPVTQFVDILDGAWTLPAGTPPTRSSMTSA